MFEKVLAPLQKAFLYEESKEAFKYTSAFLFNNSILQEKVSVCTVVVLAVCFCFLTLA